MTASGDGNPATGTHYNLLLRIGIDMMYINNVTSVTLEKTILEQKPALIGIKRIYGFYCFTFG